MTLGESYATYPVAVRAAAPAVQVNVTTPVVINNHYGGYGYSYGYGVPYTTGAAVASLPKSSGGPARRGDAAARPTAVEEKLPGGSNAAR